MLTEESRQRHSGESVDAVERTDVNGVQAAGDQDSQQPATLALADQVDDLLEAKVPSHRRGWLLRRALAAADIVGLTAALFIAEWAVGAPNGAGTLSQSTEIAAFLVSLPVWIVVARAYGLYDQDEERTDHSAPDEFSGIFHMVTVCTAGAAALSFVTGATRPTTPKLVIFWAAAIICVVLARAAARALARRTSWYLQNTLILGAGDVGQTIAHKLLQHPEYGINLVGFVDDHPKERRDDLAHLTVIGGSSDLREIVELLDIERVIVAFSGDSDVDTLQLVRTLKDVDVQVDVVPRLYELVSPGVGLHTVEGIPLVGLPKLRLSRSSRFLKRVFDVAVSSIALIILAPFFLIIAAAIKLDSRGPAFFRQTRMGSDEKTFTIFKFRTMDRRRRAAKT